MTSGSFDVAARHVLARAVLPVTVMAAPVHEARHLEQLREDAPGSRRRGPRPPCGTATTATPCRAWASVREIALIRSRSNGTPASWAIASVCRTVLVEPPIAMSSARALSNASCVDDVAGLEVLPDQLRSAGRRLAVESRSRFGSTARIVPFPGSAMPSASHRQFIVLAVNMPEHEPQVGQPVSSSSLSSSSVSLPELVRRHALEDGDQVDGLARRRPAGLHRPAADEDRRDVAAHRGHQHAGDDLVAVGDADHAVEAVGLDHRLDGVGDDLAADGSEYFMPAWPMAMPSSTPMVLNTKARRPPRGRTPSRTARPCPGGRGRG